MPATYTPENLRLWSLPGSYAGAEWNGYYSAGFGRSRESDVLEESNFAAVLAALAPFLEASEGPHDPDGGYGRNPAATCCVVRESHWAVGWVEWVAIRADQSDALRVADGLAGRYADYPVLDENDYSEREEEAADYVWRECYDTAERLAWLRDHADSPYFGDGATWGELRAVARGDYGPGGAFDPSGAFRELAH
jgi:hypothetical protein